jgi:probable rRNA maturation factor
VLSIRANNPPEIVPPTIPASLDIEILIDPTVTLPVQLEAITSAARAAARWRRFDSGEIGIRITDDATIQQINRRHLQHDFPTDVISFTYHQQPPRIEGELIISADTAQHRIRELGSAAAAHWSVANELLLYTVHGVLHLTGMEDQAALDRQRMRAAEQQIMIQLGIPAIVEFGADGERCGAMEQFT